MFGFFSKKGFGYEQSICFSPNNSEHIEVYTYPPTLTAVLRRGFWTIHGAEESSGVNSSPAGAAGQVAGKT